MLFVIHALSTRSLAKSMPCPHEVNYKLKNGKKEINENYKNNMEETETKKKNH